MQRWEIISTGETLVIYNQHVIIIYDIMNILYKHIYRGDGQLVRE